MSAQGPSSSPPLSKAAQKELPECINYVRKFNMSTNELLMYKLAAQHRLEKTAIYKAKHRAVLQAMVRAADLVAPSDAGCTPPPRRPELQHQSSSSLARQVPDIMPAYMTPAQEPTQPHNTRPVYPKAVSYATQPVQKAATPPPAPPAQRPAYMSAPPSARQMTQLYSHPPTISHQHQPTNKSKYKKKSSQQPIFLVTAGKTTPPPNGTTGYMPLGPVAQRPALSSFKTAPPGGRHENNYASVEHVEHAKPPRPSRKSSKQTRA